jgi:hypothetical protein
MARSRRLIDSADSSTQSQRRRTIFGTVCCLVCGIPFLIACLLVLGLIPLYIPHHHNNANATNGTQTNYTNVWFIQYNLDLNETVGPIDTIALGQALEGIYGFAPNTIIVLQAYVTYNTGSQTNNAVRRDVSLHDVIQRRQTSGGSQLNIYCQIQNQNQQQCTSTISSHSPCTIPLTSNGQTTQCRGSVSGIQPNCHYPPPQPPSNTTPTTPRATTTTARSVMKSRIT